MTAPAHRRTTSAAIAAVRAAGIPTQASVAPLLPCDPERLAELLDPAVDWVVVSSFRDDGARGGKTRRLGLSVRDRNHLRGRVEPGDVHAVCR